MKRIRGIKEIDFALIEQKPEEIDRNINNLKRPIFPMQSM
jgi:hypothetical protein